MRYISIVSLLALTTVPAFAKDLSCKLESAQAEINMMGMVQNVSGSASGSVIIKEIDKDKGSYTIVLKIRGKPSKTVQVRKVENQEGEVLHLEESISQEMMDISQAGSFSLVIDSNNKLSIESAVEQNGMDISESIQGSCPKRK
jgi:hypothetical protein